jgi:hypothetical protein
MKTLAALAVLMFTLAPVQPASDLTGTWIGTMTRTAPDGRTQSVDFQLNLTQKGNALTGTVGPNAERQWAIERGSVAGSEITFGVQQPEGPYRTFTLARVEDRLQGKMVAETNGQTYEATVDAGREPAKN